MEQESIILRKARVSDEQEIWRLIHAGGNAPATDQVLKELDQLFVLTYGKRILGVLCGTFTPGKEMVSWVVVHPMYPESSLRAAMILGLKGVLSHLPQFTRDQEMSKETSSKRWFKTLLLKIFPPYTLNQGCNNGISHKQRI